MSRRPLALFALLLLEASGLSALNHDECTALAEHPKGAPGGPSIGASAISSDGRLAAIGVSDGDYSGVLTFELPSGKLLWSLRNGGSPYAIAVSPNGQTLAVGSRDLVLRGDKTCPYLRVVHSSDGSLAVDLEALAEQGAQSVAFSHDGSLVAAAVAYTVNIWNTPGGVSFSSFFPPPLGRSTEYAKELVFSPDNSNIAGVGMDSAEVYVWRASTGKLIHRLPLTNKQTTGGVVFNGDGSLLAAGSGPVKVFSLKPAARGAGALAWQVPGRLTSRMNAIAFDSDGGLWINTPSGLNKWTYTRGKPAQRVVRGTTPFLAVFPLKDGGLAGIKVLRDWKPDVHAEAKLSVVDAQSGRDIGVVAVPGRPTGAR